MKTEDLLAVQAKAMAFAREHLPALVEEELEWKNAAILRNDKLRELGEILKPIHGLQHLMGAQAVMRDVLLEEYLQERKRLDWLMAHRNEFRVQGKGDSWAVFDIRNGLTFATNHQPSARAAIDHMLANPA